MYMYNKRHTADKYEEEWGGNTHAEMAVGGGEAAEAP